MANNTFTAAKGHWKSILPLFGIDAKLLDGKHHACPMCGGKDRFRFTDANGDGVFICNQCGSGHGFQFIERAMGVSFKEAAAKIDKMIGKLPPTVVAKVDDQASRKAMKELWESSVEPSADSVVGKYLTKRLGRFYKTDAIRENGNMMVARIADVSGRGVNLHLTYLTKNGDKAKVDVQKRVMRGTLPAGCAIQLWKPQEVMGIAEGIETAMSAAIIFKMPVWAAVNGACLAKWEPPPVAKKIIVFGDNDSSFTGQMRAYELANRLVVQHRLAVEVEIPPCEGDDWNDVINSS